ncbi:DNA fragmentation factor-related protein 4 isoform X2 [Oratosquilla oratoria]|uniref:DNA fragmentation factor-related protein 4 isoform X2 n=1 Tax=Oratosquilla oratoria TaxID=337810 RepID=UPI003F77662E
MLRHNNHIIKNKRKEFFITLDDDTEIDEDYFEILSDNTILKIVDPMVPSASGLAQKLAKFLELCILQQPRLHSQVQELILEEPTSDLLHKVLALVPKNEKNMCSTRADDFKWFEGLNTKYRTKEAVMRNSAESRMRGYYERIKKEFQYDPENERTLRVLQHFKDKLKKSRYNSEYFDRTADKNSRLCSNEGVFECEGEYNKKNCEYHHVINPYNSREERIIFSTWNLDHVIEKSRSILPTLVKALDSSSASDINLDYFYNLMFVSARICPKSNKDCPGNLKLVHIACHVKKPHEMGCNQANVFFSPPLVTTVTTAVGR